MTDDGHFLPGRAVDPLEGLWQNHKVRVPIACTLTSDDAAARVEEWRHFLHSSVTDSVRLSDQQLRLRLRSSNDVVDAVDLAEREKACCGFFEFSMELASEGFWFVIGVPPRAVGILDEFSGLLPLGRTREE